MESSSAHRRSSKSPEIPFPCGEGGRDRSLGAVGRGNGGHQITIEVSVENSVATTKNGLCSKPLICQHQDQTANNVLVLSIHHRLEPKSTVCHLQFFDDNACILQSGSK